MLFRDRPKVRSVKACDKTKAVFPEFNSVTNYYSGNVLDALKKQICLF